MAAPAACAFNVGHGIFYEEHTTTEDDDRKSATPEEIRSAIRGWAVLGAIIVAVFGAAYVMIDS
ncbi:hypothetical protein NKI95_21795 [Mesorhizobium sp. M0306]|uniref:hypothetical protein n=1 Tax=Mesorhizobium sp. M0306 TaxID=2956932 RepID=UPI00333D7100